MESHYERRRCADETHITRYIHRANASACHRVLNATLVRIPEELEKTSLRCYGVLADGDCFVHAQSERRLSVNIATVLRAHGVLVNFYRCKSAVRTPP